MGTVANALEGAVSLAGGLVAVTFIMLGGVKLKQFVAPSS